MTRGQEMTSPAVPMWRNVARSLALRELAYRGLVLNHWMKLGKFDQYPARRVRRERFPRRSSAALPSIAMVTPSYQQAAFVERTLRSVLEQNYPRLSYAVQDGGSKDGSAEIIARYVDRLTAWESAPDGGQAAAIVRGFGRISGDIMGWLNADDQLMPGALDFIGGYFAEHPEVDVLYGHRVVINAEDRETGRWVLPPHEDEFLRWRDYVPQETLFWRRSVWERCGGIDGRLQFALDWDLLLRLQQCGARMVRVPYFLGMFRVHAEQKTSASFTDVGMPEINALRQRALGSRFSWEELDRRVRAFRWRASWTSRLLTLGIRR